jgi:hypothetical protein
MTPNECSATRSGIIHSKQCLQNGHVCGVVSSSHRRILDVGSQMNIDNSVCILLSEIWSLNNGFCNLVKRKTKATCFG